MEKVFSQDQLFNALDPYTTEIEFAYLMGSLGTDRFHSESDIDLAIYFCASAATSLASEIKVALQLKFGREVDLVSLNKTDLIFSRQVFETGRLLLCRSPGLHLRWKADQLSRYPDFKFSRAVIEKNILKRKSYV